jgi:hypothetical protein
MSDSESKGGISWLTGMALIAAGTALVVALGVPVFVQWEHNQALQRQADWNARAAEQRNSPPSYGCVDGHYRVQAYVGPFQSTIPVWTDKGVVSCGSDGYTVNGEPITEAQAEYYALNSLTATRESHRRRNDSNGEGSGSVGPVIDYPAIAEAVKAARDAGQLNETLEAWLYE